MRKYARPIALAAGSLAIVAFGATGVAVASGSSSEGPDDQAAQDAACEAAGIPVTASNIDYDDETGICTLDSGDDGEAE